ncbi:MAG TPA: tetratricopeptide repeat protein [Longimicrobium sp.]|nr:tetratricopeptide repeat protein [Longimicrobium sp.]
MPIINEPRVRAADGPAAEDVAQQAAVQERAGNWDAAAALYAQTFRSSLHEGLTERAADALRGQARIRVQQRRFDEAEELADLSLELAQRHGLAQAAARALNVLGTIHHSRQDWPRAEGYYGRALELALDMGDDELTGLTCQNLGVVASIRGDFREARSRFLECVGSFVRSGSTANAMLAYNNLGLASSDMREWMEAEVYFSRGIEIAERLHHLPSTGMLHSNLAEPLIQVGDVQRARESLDRAEAAAGHVGDRAVLSDVARRRGILARTEGDLDDAEAHLQRALDVAGDPELGVERALALRELGEVRAAQGRWEDAAATFRLSIALFRSRGAVADAGVAERKLTELSARRVAVGGTIFHSGNEVP